MLISGLVVWLLFALYKKVPVSTGHSVVGATIGFSIVLNGFHGIQWQKIISVTISWIISPILSGLISLGVFALIDYFILRKVRIWIYVNYLNF
jgi:sodium-dependent phosphate transporter